MTRDEAIPGAVVVRLDRKGERIDPRIMRIIAVDGSLAQLRYDYSGRMLGWITLSRLRLATAEEQVKAGL